MDGVEALRTRTKMSKCKDCQYVFCSQDDEMPRLPCPKCGSTRRTIEASGEGMELSPVKCLLKFNVKSPQQAAKKPKKEFVVGDDLQKKTGEYVEKFRCIDRENDRYSEIITDPQTGEIIHKSDERLSDHKGHGSDKGRA